MIVEDNFPDRQERARLREEKAKQEIPAVEGKKFIEDDEGKITEVTAQTKRKLEGEWLMD